MSTASRLRGIETLDDFERASRRYLPRAVFEYIRNGAGAEFSLRRNREIFRQFLWQPHRLVDVSRRDPSITLFGERYAQGFGFAPIGGAAMARFDADRIAASAAARHKLLYVLSANSLTPLEEIIRINPRAWFAAYLPSDTAIVDGMVDRVQRAGYRTLMITIDVPVAARRLPETRAGYTMPIRLNWAALRSAMAHPGWSLGTFARTLLRDPQACIANVRPKGGPRLLSRKIGAIGGAASFTWEHVARIRARFAGRIVLKGVLRADDAKMAADMGVDGICVSDHGARLLDETVAPLEVLAEIRAAAGSMAVLVDSGFRSGSDVLKGLCLGADAVLIGRPFLQANVVAGAAGIDRAVGIVGAEVDRTLGFLGCRGVEELECSLLRS